MRGGMEFDMKKARIIAALLVLISLVTGVSAAADALGGASDTAGTQLSPPSGPAVISDKDETVYARLSGGGGVKNIYVVNRFTVEEPGELTDYGAYSSVTNLTDLEPLTVSDDAVSARTLNRNFYYQGYLSDNSLPWLYSIEYSLDGIKIQPEDLAGKSGALEIRLTSSKNAGIADTFYDNYMQQISVTLDTEKASEIKAEGAAAANAGKSRVLAFTVMPNTDADILITAIVRDFEMAGVDITAMPFSMDIEIPDISGMLDDFSQLPEALGEFSEGIQALEDGAAEMSAGAEQLKNGSSEFSAGLSQLDAGSAQLKGASSQIQEGLSQLAAASAGLEAMAASDPAMAALAGQLSGGISGLNQNYSDFHSGLSEYTDGVSGLASGYGEINSGVAGISDGISGLHGGISELSDGADQMYEETSKMPETISSEIDGMISGYTGGDFDPVSFTSDKNSGVSFVQFVFKSENIKKPAPVKTEEEETKQPSFWDRLSGLFGK